MYRGNMVGLVSCGPLEVDDRQVLEYEELTQDNPAVPNDKGGESQQDRNVWPDLPQNPQGVAYGGHNEADCGKEHI